MEDLDLTMYLRTGKAMKFCEVAPFALQLIPKTIMVAARTLDADIDLDVEVRG